MWGSIHKMKIGVIGNGKHSKRIQNILRKKYKIYIYSPKRPSYFDKEKFKILKECDVIFIISKNSSHYKYIKKFNTSKFIFCEKPPVNKINDLKNLKKLKLDKVYFNFNFRYFILSDLIKKYKKKLGNLIHGNIILSHGLIKKKEFLKSWRSKISENKLGVFENVTIHWIDFINYLFKIKKIEKKYFLKTSKKNYIDSLITTIRNYDNSVINIFNSYNAPYDKDLKFIFDNGLISQKDNTIEIRGPAMNLDKRKNFIKPKLIKKIIINNNSDYNNSLVKSINFFLKYAMNKKKFPKNLNNLAIEANEMILKIK